jgi:hypothetical protein
VIAAILDQLFKREDFDGDGLCDGPYLTRWTLWRHADGRAAYLHWFRGPDWAKDKHDHPKDFTSVGLWNRYFEETADGRRVEYRAPWVRKFPATHRHRIDIHPGETCWTLVFVGRPARRWGFWLRGRKFVPHKQYVREHGKERRAC